MTIWRPHSSIRAKAIGLPWRDGRFLAARVTEDSGRIKGVRPLGGTIEFGETWQQALIREFKEELAVEISISGPPQVFENIYHHEGQPGHEIIFAANVTLPKLPRLDMEDISFKEGNGMIWTAGWYTLEDLEAGGLELYPTGLKEELRNSTVLKRDTN